MNWNSFFWRTAFVIVIIRDFQYLVSLCEGPSSLFCFCWFIIFVLPCYTRHILLVMCVCASLLTLLNILNFIVKFAGNSGTEDDSAASKRIPNTSSHTHRCCIAFSCNSVAQTRHITTVLFCWKVFHSSGGNVIKVLSEILLVQRLEAT